MIIDILAIDEFENETYTDEGDAILFSFPAQFWVIDRASSPVIIFVGPFSSREEAQKCANRVEKQYQRLINNEVDLAAFKAFLEEENLERERVIVRERLKDYTLTPITPQKLKNDSYEP